MRIIKDILGRIFAFWALLVFIITAIPVSLISSLYLGRCPEPKSTIILHRMFVIWMDVFFFLTGVRRIFKGKEYFKKGQNYIVVSNHNSYMDVPLTSPGIPGANKTIAKVEIARLPIFGIIYKRGSVLVDRKSEESRKKSYLKMKEVLDLGLNMCIYPEGTRNKTSAPLQRFHDGAFRLAVDTQKPIIPTLIFNTKKVLPHNKSFYFWPHPVEMHFLPPVFPQNKDTRALKEEVYNIMYQYYTEHNKGSKPQAPIP